MSLQYLQEYNYLFWGRTWWNNCIVIWKLIPLLYSLLIQLRGSSRCTEGFSLYFSPAFFCYCSPLIALNVASVLLLRLHFLFHVFFYSFLVFFLIFLSNFENPNALHSMLLSIWMLHAGRGLSIRCIKFPSGSVRKSDVTIVKPLVVLFAPML